VARRTPVRPGPRFDVAIHAPFATSLYVDGQPPGGAEVQSMRLALGLADAGLRVCHVVHDAPDLPDERDGVSLIGERPPGATPLHTAGYCADALLRADSHVYIQRSAPWATGLVGAVARARRRAFVFSSSCDIDFSGDYLPSRRDRALFAFGAKLASATVVQSRDQARLAEGRTNPRARVEVIPSFGPDPSTGSRTTRQAFLWIGRSDEVKRPMLYLELAAAVPAATFWMVTHTTAEERKELNDAVVARAGELANVVLLPARPHRELLDLYPQAVAVVNTSSPLCEGFPNVFMEAWAAGTPALSLDIDPDGVIRRRGLGMTADGSMAVLIAAAERLWADRGASSFAETTLAYLEAFHSRAAVGARWARLVESLIPGGRAAAA